MCCGKPLEDKDGQKVCGSCGAWYQGVMPPVVLALLTGGAR
ncbi:hypothetical protein [Streptomyces olivaceus]